MAAQHHSRLTLFPKTAFPEAAFPKAALAGLLGLLAGLGAPSSVRAQEPVTFGLHVLVAEAEGTPVVDDSWIEERVRWANRLFEPAAIAFEERSRAALASEHTDLVSRADRHALGPLVEAPVIHVFVVRSLANVDVEGDFIRGVHWRSRRGGAGPGGQRRHYVILSSIAGPTVLAHELGHFFGNPHSATPGNIMSYARGSVAPFFDAGQLRRIRRHRERFVRTRELRPVAPLAEGRAQSSSSTK